MNQKFNISVIFLVTGIFIGFFLTIQFKSTVPPSTYFYDELQAQKKLIDSFLDDQNHFKNEIIVLRQNLEKEQKKSNLYVKTDVLNKLQSLKDEIGLSLKKGAGIVVYLDDGDNSEDNQFLVNSADLRDIVNALFTAKAEAISINDQRIIASTPITSVGNTIMVNNYHILPPFKIIAIGDQYLMKERLNDNNLLSDLLMRIENKQIKFNLSIKNNLTCSMYNGELSVNFIKPVSKN